MKGNVEGVITDLRSGFKMWISASLGRAGVLSWLVSRSQSNRGAETGQRRVGSVNQALLCLSKCLGFGLFSFPKDASPRNNRNKENIFLCVLFLFLVPNP